MDPVCAEPASRPLADPQGARTVFARVPRGLAVWLRRLRVSRSFGERALPAPAEKI